MAQLNLHSVDARQTREILNLIHPDYFTRLMRAQSGSPDSGKLPTSNSLAAFQFGYESYPLYQGQRFESVESILEEEWNASQASSGVSWKDSRAAAKEGWRVLDQILVSTKPMNGADHDARHTKTRHRELGPTPSVSSRAMGP